MTSQAEVQRVVDVIDREVDAVRHSDAEAYFAVLADDAVFMAPNEPFRSGDALRGWLRDFLEAFGIEWLQFERVPKSLPGWLMLSVLCMAASLMSCQGPDSDTAASSPTARASAANPSASGDPVDPRCALPGPPRVLRQDGHAVLLVWQFPADRVYSELVIPPDSGYLAFRTAVRADSADLRRPIADAPQPKDSAEAALWRDEEINNELAQSGEVGRIETVDCLDALLFAFQNARVSELSHPTEFLASVLRRESGGRVDLTVVFGAGDDMFPPKSVYGSDVVEQYVARGWRYWYVIHNHTLQRNGDRIALGNPTLSTSDVQLVRSLAAERGLESARVTNGFYTFSASAEEFSRMRSR